MELQIGTSPGTQILWFSFSFTFFFQIFYVLLSFHRYLFAMRSDAWKRWRDVQCALYSNRYDKSQKRFNLFFLLNFIICECILLHIFFLFFHVFRFVFIWFLMCVQNFVEYLDFLIGTLKFSDVLCDLSSWLHDHDAFSINIMNMNCWEHSFSHDRRINKRKIYWYFLLQSQAHLLGWL